MFVGFTGQSWNKDRETSLYPGQSYAVQDYKLTYAGARMEVDPNKRMVFADVDVYRHGSYEGRLSPAKFIYKKQPESPTTEVAISHGLRDDVYVIVGTINPSDNNLAAFEIHVNPLVSWIWIGCIVLIFGSAICMWPQFELGESRVWAGARGLAATAASVLLGIMLAATPAAHAQGTSSLHSGTVHIENDLERGIFEHLRCMCGGCERLPLSSCGCSTAEDARQRVRERIRAGETRDQILAEYASESWPVSAGEQLHGPDSINIPPNRGVLKAIYLVPVVAIALGAAGLARLLRRWRGGGASGASATGIDPQPANATDAYDSRLDDELKDLDG
jgi:cytochrome c-type biogenesis protein CcmF